MNSDVWRTPQGQTGVEIARQQTSRGDIVRLAMNGGDGFPQLSWHPAHALTPEKPRYEGARGGRVGSGLSKEGHNLLAQQALESFRFHHPIITALAETRLAKWMFPHG